MSKNTWTDTNGIGENDLRLVQVVNEILLGSQLAEQVLVLVVLDAALLRLGDLIGFHRKLVLINS